MAPITFFFSCIWNEKKQELVSLLQSRDATVKDLNEYIGVLLARVMDECPKVLETPERKSKKWNPPFCLFFVPIWLLNRPSGHSNSNSALRTRNRKNKENFQPTK